MHARAERALEEVALDECRIAVEILAETRTRFLGMDQADGDPVLNQFRKDGKEWDRSLATDDMHVLDICGDDPQKPPGGRNLLLHDPCVNGLVENQFCHALGASLIRA